jgi:serine/threonine protein kinase
LFRLYSRLDEIRGLPLGKLVGLFRQMATSIKEIQEHGIIHMDIKPDNFLFRSESHIVLADFGLSFEDGYVFLKFNRRTEA